MSSQYAFYFDSSTCSGCKACQVACKDKHGLEVGLLWRRVYEVSGGSWQLADQAWTTNAFAYYLSISCNHCEIPICVEVCPTGAMVKRPDGIVLIDEKRCIGCQYCSWACPYGAPQLDATRGCMTKCTLCADLLDLGQAPACVSACPMRCLDFGNLEDLEMRYGQAMTVFPLPQPALTKPALVIHPHPAAQKAAVSNARIANGEEASAGSERISR